ncbi:hypothetical protein [Hymenobacter negativus]|uniref:Uncharacterized protein n=1 Tax=Hymenobacter negativus TaxID=2795026 RepID=A0ABS3QKK4_9BACT|nr:hypothetical protein [Hymenobacter negativus]MBO2011794.1 hypothetical protein [Hymenobacter negativus]
MPASPNSRFLMAAMVLLLLFVAAYEAAVRWPGQPVLAAQPPNPAAPPDSTTVSEPSLTALASPAPTTPPVQTEHAPQRTPRPVFTRGNWWARRPRLLHRYVGTVGGQPATALLEWQNPDSVSGSFYLHRRGPGYRLSTPLPPAQHPVQRRGWVLAVDAYGWSGSSSEWRLHGKPGATLTGTWRGGPTGRFQPVMLREDYTNGVRLAIQTWWVHGNYTITDAHGRRYSAVPVVRYEFMHLPDPASVPPALRPILSPGPAGRRGLLLEGGDGDCITDQKLSVQLNDFGLFSYSYEEYCSIIGGAADERYRYALLDLRAGRWLTPMSQLIPDYQAGLARLLAHHLLYDDEYWLIRHDSTWRRQLTPYLRTRPDTLAATTRWLLANTPVSVGKSLLTGTGLEIADWRGNYIQAFPRETFTWFIPYAELRPLVRPGTPLARMLRARGLW